MFCLIFQSLVYFDFFFFEKLVYFDLFWCRDYKVLIQWQMFSWVALRRLFKKLVIAITYILSPSKKFLDYLFKNKKFDNNFLKRLFNFDYIYRCHKYFHYWADLLIFKKIKIKKWLASRYDFNYLARNKYFIRLFNYVAFS